MGNVKVAHQEIKCPAEKIAETGTSVTFPNIANTGDCMGDALRTQKKDVSKFTIDINSDGSLTFQRRLARSQVDQEDAGSLCAVRSLRRKRSFHLGHELELPWRWYHEL